MDVINYLSGKFYLPEQKLMQYLQRAPHRYRKYFIPKRNGRGVREIAQPARELKLIQLTALELFQPFLPVHDKAMAYRIGVGIKDNARRHVKNTYLLKMDFRDFFPSIGDEDFIRHVVKYMGEGAAEQRDFLSKIFFWSPGRGQSLRLSIGAPSSPFISNTLLYDFDCVVEKYCLEREISYTRYADDLTFSTNHRGALFGVPEFIVSVCDAISYPRLNVNHEKTVFSSKKNNRHVTGLVLDNEGNVSLGRDKKREIRSRVFRFSQGGLTDVEVRSLAGLIAYARHVEPGFYKALVRKYGVEVLMGLRKQQD